MRVLFFLGNLPYSFEGKHFYRNKVQLACDCFQYLYVLPAVLIVFNSIIFLFLFHQFIAFYSCDDFIAVIMVHMV
jgi:hypothetical protein